MENDVLTTLKILIVGESGVGKSRYSLLKIGLNLISLKFVIKNVAKTAD